MPAIPSHSLSFDREFEAGWPQVLELMMDFFETQALLVAPWQSVRIEIHVSRQRVAPKDLQPHVQKFKTAIAATKNSKVEFVASHEDKHMIKLTFWRI